MKVKDPMEDRLDDLEARVAKLEKAAKAPTATTVPAAKKATTPKRG